MSEDNPAIGDVPRKFFLVGNPNCGKTSLFNALTGERRYVGNWPGVTVECIEGVRRHKSAKSGNRAIDLAFIDLPGSYSLSPVTPEEEIVLTALKSDAQTGIINVLDGPNLERNLFLTVQLLELGIKPILVLNCCDALRAQGTEIRTEELQRVTGCPVFATVARTGEGVAELLDALVTMDSQMWQPPGLSLVLPTPWFEATDDLLRTQGESWEIALPLARYSALREFLNVRSEDRSDVFVPICRKLLERIQSERGSPVQILELPCELASNRYERIARITSAVIKKSSKTGDKKTERLDAIFTHKWLGLPLFALMMAIMFLTTFHLSEFPVELMNRFLAFGKTYLTELIPEGLIRELIVDGIWAGVGGILVFLPNVLILFLWIALLEDSGYLARAAFLMDRIMQSIGLHGRAFIPFLMGFGCNVPAIMATRIIENPNQRLFSIFLIPLVSCAARLPLLVLLCGFFFPRNPGLWLFGLYCANFAVLLILARFARTIFQSDSKAPFMLEMPPYRLPTVKSVLRLLWDKAYHFLEKAGTVILAGTIIIWLLSAFPREVTFSRDYDALIASLENRRQAGEKIDGELAELMNAKELEKTEGRYMARIGKHIHFLVRPLGMTWREAVALIPGFLAKESVISTLSVLYNPLGDSIGEGMQKTGMNPLSALGFMLFTLLYVPCLPTVGVIWRESRSMAFTVLVIMSHILTAWIVCFSVIKTGGFLLEASQRSLQNIVENIALVIIVAVSLILIFKRMQCDIFGLTCRSCSHSGICGRSRGRKEEKDCG